MHFNIGRACGPLMCTSVYFHGSVWVGKLSIRPTHSSAPGPGSHICFATSFCPFLLVCLSFHLYWSFTFPPQTFWNCKQTLSVGCIIWLPGDFGLRQPFITFQVTHIMKTSNIQFTSKPSKSQHSTLVYTCYTQRAQWMAAWCQCWNVYNLYPTTLWPPGLTYSVCLI